jgi:hypothetical protein
MTADSEILAELREQTKWLRLLGFRSLRPLISEVLTSERDRLVYELSDGVRTARELGKVAGVSHPTVLRLWQDWRALGLCVESTKQPGRAEHLVALSRLGISVPMAGVDNQRSEALVTEGSE